MTNQEILKIAMAQSAVDLSAGMCIEKILWKLSEIMHRKCEKEKVR